MHREPPTYMINFVKDKHIEFDIEVFQADDLPFVPILLTMPVNKIRIFKANDKKKTSVKIQGFYETSKFRDFLKEVSNAIENLQTLKSVIFEGFPFQVKHMPILNSNDSLSNSAHIK